MNENHSALKTPNLWETFLFLATEAGEEKTEQKNDDKDDIV